MGTSEGGSKIIPVLLNGAKKKHLFVFIADAGSVSPPVSDQPHEVDVGGTERKEPFQTWEVHVSVLSLWCVSGGLFDAGLPTFQVEKLSKRHL